MGETLVEGVVLDHCMHENLSRTLLQVMMLNLKIGFLNWDRQHPPSQVPSFLTMLQWAAIFHTHPIWSRSSYLSSFLRKSPSPPSAVHMEHQMTGAENIPIPGGIPVWARQFGTEAFSCGEEAWCSHLPW